MTDTHTHLYLQDFTETTPDAVERAIASGVGRLIFPNIDVESIPAMKDLHSRHPDNTFMAMGLHPTEVVGDWETVVEMMERELEKGGYVAVGEVGIDLYWDKSEAQNQKKAFGRQLDIAEKRGLPVIIHCREALDETLEVISSRQLNVPLIFHSFTGSRDDVKRIRGVSDAYFGINGVVTYKNAADLRDALTEIGLDRILLETDSPYLTPVPHRGKRNESAYLCHVRDKVAETMGATPEEVETVTDHNAEVVFGL